MSYKYIALFVFLLSVEISVACFSSGIGCCGPPPPAPVCGGGCGGGYACGPYGCARMRARAASSKTVKINKDGDDVSKHIHPC